METLINGWVAFVRSDVYAGTTQNEDGETREELSFYVVCEDERGARYASSLSYTTEDFSRDEAEARVRAFGAKVEVGLREGADPSKSDKWHRIQGCYGTAAWSETDELELEARSLEVEAGVSEADRFRRDMGLS